MDKLFEHELYLRLLHQADPRICTALIRFGSPSFLSVLTACALNVLLRNVPVNDHELKILRRHRKTIHGIACQTQRCSAKRRTLLSKTGLRILRLIVELVLRALDADLLQ